MMHHCLPKTESMDPSETPSLEHPSVQSSCSSLDEKKMAQKLLRLRYFVVAAANTAIVVASEEVLLLLCRPCATLDLL